MGVFPFQAYIIDFKVKTNTDSASLLFCFHGAVQATFSSKDVLSASHLTLVIRHQFALRIWSLKWKSTAKTSYTNKQALPIQLSHLYEILPSGTYKVPQPKTWHSSANKA